jgi:cytosine/adenosine deaminase-related metal-dependent hydrolase
MPNEYIDLIIIDPPFGCNATLKGDYNDDEEYIKTKIPLWLSELKRVYKYSVKNNYDIVHPQNIFDMITINAAQALNLDKDIGSIEVGKKADLAIWQRPGVGKIKEEKVLTNLFFSTNKPKLEFLIIDGKSIIIGEVTTVFSNRMRQSFGMQ